MADEVPSLVPARVRGFLDIGVSRIIRESLGWILAAAFCLWLTRVPSLDSALELSGDEGYELMKGYLVREGHALYLEIWNDQPPLHTQVVALLFRWFGTSAYVGRCLSAACGGLLLAVVYGLVRSRGGAVPAFLAAVLLLASPYFLQLSASVMLELPAMALAYASVWALSTEGSRGGRASLLLSGALFAGALQVKWTVVLVLPGMLALAWSRRYAQVSGGNWRRFAWWFGAFSIVTCVLLLVTGGLQGLVMAFQSHFSRGTAESAAGEEFRFEPGLILADLGVGLPAGVGVARFAWRRSPDLLVPVVLLFTAVLVHCWHRPFWYYYQLHFAVPMVWLAGRGIWDWMLANWRAPTLPRGARIRCAVSWASWLAVVSLMLTFLPEALRRESNRVAAAPVAAQDPMVQDLSERSAPEDWVFTDRPACAFWARRKVPPELAVIPFKRIWSRQIDGDRMGSWLERYRPKLVLFATDWESRFGLSDYLHRHYEVVFAASSAPLYVRQ